jgi:hypothetical protein
MSTPRKRSEGAKRPDQSMILKMRAFIHSLRNTDGAEIAEAALVLPVVFVFLLGIIWFGRAFNIYSTIQQAAQQGALVAARPTCATCGAPNSPWPNTTFAGDGTVTSTIFSVMQASSLDPAQVLSNSNPPSPMFCTLPPPLPQGACSTGSTTGNVTICREVLLNPSQNASQPQICGTLVSFQYPFQFYLPFTSLNLRQIVLTAQAQSRIEN